MVKFLLRGIGPTPASIGRGSRMGPSLLSRKMHKNDVCSKQKCCMCNIVVPLASQVSMEARILLLWACAKLLLGFGGCRSKRLEGGNGHFLAISGLGELEKLKHCHNPRHP